MFPRNIVCFRNIRINILHKGDDDDDGDDGNNNNNNNNNNKGRYVIMHKSFIIPKAEKSKVIT